MTAIPTVASYLPEFISFARRLAEDTASAKISDWELATQQVRLFFTPSIIDRVDAVIPGWREMSSYAEGVTLTHVMLVFAALLHSPEYQSADPVQQTLLQWIVLFHDVSKIVHDVKRDNTHAFRSAAFAARQLPRLGFDASASFATDIEHWAAFTANAATEHDETHELIQDNRQLPKILRGIDELFGQTNPAALIVKTVLFHLSVTVTKAWPQAAPLTDDEICLYVDDALLALLKVMMIVDGEGWEFFDLSTRNQGRVEALAVFDRLQQRLLAVEEWNRDGSHNRGKDEQKANIEDE